MATEPLKLHMGVSPALHPDVLSTREAALSGRSATALVAGKSILEGFYRTQSNILNARAASFDKVRTPANLRLLQSARDGRQRPGPGMIMGKSGKLELSLPSAEAKILNTAIDEAFVRAASHYDKARVTIEGELKKFLAERASKVTDPNARTPAGIAAAAEIRTHMKSLPNNERVALIRAEIQAGNSRVAAAVTEAEPFLSGLDPKTHANLISESHKVFAPEETAKIEAVSSVLKTVDDAAALAIKAYGDALVPVVGQDAAAEAALSALKTGA